MRFTSLALALAAGFVTSAHAETLPEYIGETIVVTPTRFPQTLSGQASNTTVITRRQIEDSPQTSLPALLAQQAGVGRRDLFGESAGAGTVDMRGFGAAAGQNTLILLDGRRLNDIDLSTIDWLALPLATIEQVEIVRGGSSVLHGAGAVAGVINIITRSPVDTANEAEAEIQLGSFDRRGYQVSGNVSGDAAGVRITADHGRSEGWRDNNTNKQSSVNGDARWRHGGGELAVKFGGASQETRLPGARTVEADMGIDQLATDPEGASTPLDWASRKGYQAGLSNRLKWGGGEVLLDLDYRNKQQKSYFDFGGFPDYRDADLDMWAFSPRTQLPFATGGLTHRLTLGADVQRWDYRLRVSNAEANVGTPVNRIHADQRSAGFYVRDDVQLSTASRLSVGARHEWFEISATDQYDSSAPGATSFSSGATPGQQDESQYAWELGLNHRVTANHALFARLARSYRFATVDELYEYSPLGSREFQFLKPQTAQDAQLGWEWRDSRSGARAAAYYMRVRDEIHLDVFSSGIGNTNLPPLARYGLELEAHHRVNSVALRAAYTLATAKFTEGTLNGVMLKGNDVPLVPRHKLALGAVWPLGDRTRLAADAQYVSTQRMENDELNQFKQKIPAYTLVDLKLTHQIGQWRISAALNNVFDAEYYTYAVHSTTNLDRFNAYPLAGRNAWISLGYTFD